MTDLPNSIDEKIVEDEDEDEDEDHYSYAEYGYVEIEDTVWEDQVARSNIRLQYPDAFILKIANYRAVTFVDIEEWCEENCRDRWEKVGWRTGCHYTVAMAIWNSTDAVAFRLMWSN